MNPAWIPAELRRAYMVAAQSPDPSTQIAALTYDHERNRIAAAHNGPTKGIALTPERLERPAKYDYMMHAEARAVIASLAAGRTPHIMVGTWAACATCARTMVEGGVLVLVRHAIADPTGRWHQSIASGDEILRAAGVEIIDFAGHLGAATIRMDGKEFHP